jgi:hypothetical protein
MYTCIISSIIDVFPHNIIGLHLEVGSLFPHVKKLIYNFKNFNEPEQNQENDVIYDRIYGMQRLVASNEI